MRHQQVQSLILLSSIALILLVYFQVRWIGAAKELREEQFEHRVQMALCSTVETLGSNPGLCSDFRSCLNTAKRMKTGKKPILEDFDSLLDARLRNYNLPPDYMYDLRSDSGTVPLLSSIQMAKPDRSYACSLDDLGGQSGWEIEVLFPEKESYVLSQMSFMLASSFLIILLITGFFAWSIRTVWKQQKIAQRNIDFFNNLAHELKTPLTNIGLAASRLEKQKNVFQPGKADRFLGLIRSENQNLKEQVERILHLSQMESEPGVMPVRQLNAHDLLIEAVSAFQVQVESRGGRIITDFQAGDPFVSGNAEQLMTAFRNLLDNANKYSPEAPLIHVKTENSGSKLCISIADRGMGIPKSEQEQVFSRYYRCSQDHNHDVKGFGLGLSLTQAIVRAHQGWIHLKSKVQQGTAFHIYLPQA